MGAYTRGRDSLVVVFRYHWLYIVFSLPGVNRFLEKSERAVTYKKWLLAGHEDDTMGILFRTCAIGRPWRRQTI